MGKFDKKKRFGGNRPFGGGGKFGGGHDHGRPTMHKAVCSQCGNECEVPFKPTGDRPVFCNACFDKQGGAGGQQKFGGGERRERPRFGDKQMFDATCSKCGARCQVPFRPTPGKQVFCNNCFDKGGVSPARGGADYSAQFKMLNEKMDKLIRLLSPSVPSAVVEKAPAKPAEKKAEKPVKKTAKAKPAAKKAPAKKKK